MAARSAGFIGVKFERNHQGESECQKDMYRSKHRLRPAPAEGTIRRRPRPQGRRRWPPRRAGQTRQAQLRAQKESLPFLRRPRRLHRLQEGRDSGAVHSGARKNSSAPHDRHLLAPSALAHGSHQARAEYRAAAVCRGTVTGRIFRFRHCGHSTAPCPRKAMN